MLCTELKFTPAVDDNTMVAVADQYNSAITSIQLERTLRGNKPKRKRPRYWLSL